MAPAPGGHLPFPASGTLCSQTLMSVAPLFSSGKLSMSLGTHPFHKECTVTSELVNLLCPLLFRAGPLLYPHHQDTVRAGHRVGGH